MKLTSKYNLKKDLPRKQLENEKPFPFKMLQKIYNCVDTKSAKMCAF